MVKLEELTVIRALQERCFDLARSVEVHLTGNVHCGETALGVKGITTGLISLGQRVTWRARHFGVWQNFTSGINYGDEPPQSFPGQHDSRCLYSFMNHDHFFHSLPNEHTEMRDVFCFAAPLPGLGHLAEALVVRRYMKELLRGAEFSDQEDCWIDREMGEFMGELAGNEPGIPDTWNFSIEVAKGWEEAFLSKATPRTRKIALRSSFTFSPDRNGHSMCYRLWFVVALAARKEMVNNMFPRSTKRISSERIA